MSVADWLGAGVVAAVEVSVGRVPQVGTAVEDVVGPPAVGLQPVMPAAERRCVAGAGRAALTVRD